MDSAKMAGHWLGEAVAPDCAFKPLVESPPKGDDIRAFPRSHIHYLTFKVDFYPTLTCQKAGFLFICPIWAVFLFGKGIEQYGLV